MSWLWGVALRKPHTIVAQTVVLKSDFAVNLNCHSAGKEDAHPIAPAAGIQKRGIGHGRSKSLASVIRYYSNAVDASHANSQEYGVTLFT